MKDNNNDVDLYQDPLTSLDALFEKQRNNSFIDEKKVLINEIDAIPNFTPESNYEFSLSSAMSLKNNSEEQLVEPLDSRDSYYESNQALQENYLLASPLLTGLGVNLSNTEESHFLHNLVQEMGESLQACIKGLLAIHQQAGASRFDTFNRNLQPIEDNPLRLGLSYDETVRVMYDDEKSAVHLSPAAAISESLKRICKHNEAVQYATSKALAQILEAFSPETLLKRFKQYRRDPAIQVKSDESWAWLMYKQYYQELTSARQLGFEKLYWEIVEQEYDRKIRLNQKEG